MVAAIEHPTSMVPDESRLPQVLPTDRLTATGMPVPELRTELRRIDDLRSVGSVLLTIGQPIVTIGLAMWFANPVTYALAFLLMGPAFARLAILGHEAAHRLMFSKKRWNDLVGKWLICYPGF